MTMCIERVGTSSQISRSFLIVPPTLGGVSRSLTRFSVPGTPLSGKIPSVIIMPTLKMSIKNIISLSFLINCRSILNILPSACMRHSVEYILNLTYQVLYQNCIGCGSNGFLCTFTNCFVGTSIDIKTVDWYPILSKMTSFGIRV